MLCCSGMGGAHQQGILNLASGGGLGQAIYNNLQLGFYTRLSTLILLIYALVLTSDWIGERLRLRVA